MKAETHPAAGTAAVEIEPATLRDILPLYRLEKRCFPVDSWPLIDVFAALVLPRLVRFKAVERGRIIGFVMGERERGTGWIATFGVDPDYRNLGIGTRLLLQIEAALETQTYRLCVRTSNETALRLYKRHGYRVVDVWPVYYRGGEDALVMEKTAGPSAGA